MSSSRSLSVLLVHGVRTSSTMWRRQVATLSAAGHPVLAIDLPGHGTRRGEEFTLDGAAAAVQDGVDALDEPCVVVGLSLGGYVVLHWAARATRPVARVVASSCCSDPHGLGRAGYLLISRGFARLPDGGEAASNRTAARLLGPQAVRDLAAGGIAVESQVPALQAMAHSRPLADLARITMPVTFLNGSWDHFRTHERAFLRAARDAELVLVPRANHLVSLHRPLAYDRALLEILARTATGSDQGSVSDQTRTPPRIPALFGATTTSSPRRSSTCGVRWREFPPPK